MDGRWGSGPAEATLQADAAAALGVDRGDTLSIEGTEVTVVGTWRLTDIEAPRWQADELWTTGTAGTVAGPLIIDPSVWSRTDAEPWVHWAVIPDVPRLQATDLAAIKDVWGGIPNDLEAAGLRTGSRSGQFLVAVQELSTRLAALQTALPLALVILATIAALTIWELAGLTARTRATETALLWSRGGSTASLSLRAGAEAAAVSAIGCAAGVAAAAAILGSTRGADAAASVLVSGGWAGAAVVAVSALAFFLRTVRFAGPERVADRAGRARGFAGVGGVVLLLIAAALSTWQLLRYGPITVTAFNDVSVDPVTVVAPALLLASIVLLGLYAFPLLAAAAERAAIRSTGLALAVRGVSRRIGTTTATIVMIGLAVGQLMLAAGYSATWSEAFTQAQELRAGTALRLKGPIAGSIDLDLDRAAGATDVTGLAPAHTISVSVGGEEASLLGVAPAAVAALTTDARGLIDPDALSAAITTPGSAAQLPADATTVTVDMGRSAAIAQSVWLADAWGRLENLTLTPSPQTPGISSAELPAVGRAPWQLVGIDLAPTDDAADAPIAVHAVTTDAGAVGPVPSELVAFRDGGEALSRDELDSEGVPSSPGALLRLLPAGASCPWRCRRGSPSASEQRSDRGSR